MCWPHPIPYMISIKKQDVPVSCKEDMDLLENLLQQQLSATEPDIVSELKTLINAELHTVMGVL